MTKRRWRLWRRQRPRNRHTARSRRSIPASLWHRTHIMWDYVGHIKGVGHIYQQTVIDTYSKIGFAKLYDRKNALVAADMLNDRVVPFFEQHDLRVMRMLTDRGTEYCGNRETHEFELYLAIEASTTRKSRQRARRQTVSARGSTGQCRTSSTPSPSVRRFTHPSTSFRRTLTRG